MREVEGDDHCHQSSQVKSTSYYLIEAIDHLVDIGSPPFIALTPALFDAFAGMNVLPYLVFNEGDLPGYFFWVQIVEGQF